MITGLKIAKGASVNVADGSEAEAKAGITLAEFGGASIKPLIQAIRNRTSGISFDSSTDFILAFRVRRVVRVGDEVRHKLSFRGTSMLDGDEERRADDGGKAALGEEYSAEEAKRAAEEDRVDIVCFDEEGGECEDGKNEKDNVMLEWIAADVAPRTVNH